MLMLSFSSPRIQEGPGGRRQVGHEWRLQGCSPGNSEGRCCPAFAAGPDSSVPIVFLCSVLTALWLCCSQASRTEVVCDQLIDSDARALYEAGEGRKGKDCAMFIEILATRSFPHLRQGLPDASPAVSSHA